MSGSSVSTATTYSSGCAPIDPPARSARSHLPGTEFIGRFLHHVLPPGFKRIRHYGLLSPARKKNGLAAARAALECRRHPEVIESGTSSCRVARIEPAHCPHCGIGQFRVGGALA
ncbi:MAG: transposase [Propionivibrio sp.]|nr:transposase [Propionivibrio sp.]MBK8894540.1 transposase [Propionivibrio sp.]